MMKILFNILQLILNIKLKKQNENLKKNGYFQEILCRIDMTPQIYPSKFSDCSNSKQVYEKIMKQKYDLEH